MAHGWDRSRLVARLFVSLILCLWTPGVVSAQQNANAEIEALIAEAGGAFELYNAGRLQESAAVFESLIPRFAAAGGVFDMNTLQATYWLAQIKFDLGRYVEAERYARQVAVALQDEFEDGDPRALSVFDLLGTILGRQYRYAEAEEVWRDLIRVVETHHGKTDERLPAYTLNLANQVDSQGRYSEADGIYQEATRLTRSQFGEEQTSYYLVLANHAVNLGNLDRLDEARDMADQAIAGLVRLNGADHESVAKAKLVLSTIPAGSTQDGAVEREKVAVALSGESREYFERVLGLSHPLTLAALNLEAKTTAESERILGDMSRALAIWEYAFEGLPEYYSFASGSALSLLSDSQPLDIDVYFRALSNADLAAQDAARRGFVAQGWWTINTLDVSVTDLGARLSSKDTYGSSLSREFQEARESVETARENLLGAINNPNSPGSRELESVSGEVSRAEVAYSSVLNRLGRDAPELLDAHLPRALTSEEAQAMLEPGEAMVVFASVKDVLYVWKVERDEITWRHLFFPRESLSEYVSDLRSSLDFNHVGTVAPVRSDCAVLGPGPDPRYFAPSDNPFDACRAEELYDILLGQFDLSDTGHLIVVPDGPLERLPFSLLVSGMDLDGSPRWLIEDHAISVLPTTSTLRMLRRQGLSKDRQDQKPYLGIAPVEFRDRPEGTLLRVEVGDLPGTLTEVQRLAGVLGAGESGYVTHERANEAFVKRAPLWDYRIVSFATHGLLSQEAAEMTGGGITEPALLLATAGDGEDGLLTASEAASLALDAEWVLLSGCNTAAGDGEGAEGLSGLARAFFFAGARSLLVSHWSVEDNSALRLMTETMTASATGEVQGKDEALRQAMLTVMSEPGYEHPFYWAPFELVGDNR